jgi:hypothetical protein
MESQKTMFQTTSQKLLGESPDPSNESDKIGIF